MTSMSLQYFTSYWFRIDFITLVMPVFVGEKSIFRHYCIENVKDGIQIQVYKINNDSVAHCSQLISVKVKKILRKSLAELWGKV